MKIGRIIRIRHSPVAHRRTEACQYDLLETGDLKAVVVGQTIDEDRWHILHFYYNGRIYWDFVHWSNVLYNEM